MRLFHLARLMMCVRELIGEWKASSALGQLSQTAKLCYYIQDCNFESAVKINIRVWLFVDVQQII